ncbi:MAG: hypothetical protein ABSC77_08265 [Terracidiphilus sp.]|jgi:hypothetical protein
MSTAAALLVAAALAGCGNSTYFAGRALPPSGLANRVLIAIQNPSAYSTGALQFVDAYYDIRFQYNSANMSAAFSISGYAGNLPVTIQNMPEELTGAVYSSGDGGFNLISYSSEKLLGNVSGFNGKSSSIFITRNQSYAFAANQSTHELTVVDRSVTSPGSYALNLPGVYRVSVNPGGSAALAFVQNSNFVYYPRKLTAAESLAYAGGPNTWPKAAVDCEPQNVPGWCLFQAQSPDNIDSTGNPYGAPLVFDRPVKAVFSSDGGTAYVLNCGPECGGNASSVSLLPVAPIIYLIGQQSGTLPAQSALSTICTVSSTSGCTIPVPHGASNALVSSSTMYAVGQKQMPDYCGGSVSHCWGGYLTVVNLSTNTVSSSVSISDGAPGAMSRMLLADDNTLWIGMTQCTNGERANNNLPYGCLTMFNTSTNTVTLLEPYVGGDATGIAAVTGLHKIYTAEGGQVYIYSTLNGTEIDNQYVTVTGTAYDVAYMDAISDDDNTVY